MAIDWSKKIVTEWRQVAQMKSERIRKLNVAPHCRNMNWSPPEAGKFKINVDAAVKLDADRYSIGMVIRDCSGQFVAGKVGIFFSSYLCLCCRNKRSL